ncbi:dihydroxyacetone kinase subunit L [Virgibacillus profundi]|uniref:phosphoenolpyruvate--glycerone phosphotransferase n=2 Tax=Virgibacillus TaxID=84406 RepID=A0A2A2IH17_9BACI|nr:dihydroxyacetone kinase subunit DhaL [Virgibacillus profundi]PAV30927.1 dihydroxyacetone kinase subunit L [Virgibacillus profundi]PXY55112.1 dihydroxyacetone kinase subunit L [Virgibacillus profundi]
MELQVKDIIQWFELTNEKIQANKDYLTSLDQPIGDGDHGINMARGFKEVVNKISTQDYENVADVLKDVAMTLMSKVGGASGPIFGTAFLKLSIAVKGSDSLNFETFTKGLEEAVNGVKQRGKATEGEKTMIDVWSPVVDYLKSEKDFQGDQIRKTAKQAMENTKEIMATKGRASYFKEKSIGHIDPGAASSFYIFEALAEVIKGGN